MKKKSVIVGTIVAWAKSLAGVPQQLTNKWVECNGQTLADAESPLDGTTIPNLNASGGGTQRFLRGATTSGGTGTGSHTHTFTIGATYNNTGAGGTTALAAGDYTTEATTILPPFYQVVWIMRVK